MAGASIFSIIVSKLYHEKKPCPIILLKVDKNLKIGFHYTNLSLCLAVCLQVEGSEESMLDIKEIT